MSALTAAPPLTDGTVPTVGKANVWYGVWSARRRAHDWYADLAHAALVARGRGSVVLKVTADWEHSIVEVGA